MSPAAPVRILFMGTPAFAVPSLLALIEPPSAQWQVVGVLTQPDRPAGRGRVMTPSDVKVAAQQHAIPVFEFTKLRAAETQDALRALRADLAIVVAYGRILPPALLSLPRLGCINVHASLLPHHRGASPIAHAILAGDEHTGVSIMQLDEGLDTGPVFTKRSMPIPADATCASLTTQLAQFGARVLIETLPGICTGTLRAEPQVHRHATYAPILHKHDAALDFSGNAIDIARRIRAFNPWPGAYTFFEGTGTERIRIQIRNAIAHERSIEHGNSLAATPGTIIAANPTDGLLVACGRGALRILSLKPDGRAEMPAEAWMSGRKLLTNQRFFCPSQQTISLSEHQS